MSRVTPRLELTVWDLLSDPFDHVELADNWDAIDAQIFISKGVEILAALPTAGNFAGRVVMLSAPSGGFQAWTLCRYSGAAWGAVGSIEIHPTLPPTSYEGRMIILSSGDSTFSAWTLLRYAGAEWRQIGDVTVAVDGVNVGARSTLNFIEGSGVTVNIVDDNGTEKVGVTINTTVNAVNLRKNGVDIGNRQTLNFIEGDNVTLAITTDLDEVNIEPNIDDEPALPGTAMLDYAIHVDNSAGKVQLGSGSTSTWSEFHNTNLRVDFTVPDSGRVLIAQSGGATRSSSNVIPQWGVTTGGGSVVTGSKIGLLVEQVNAYGVVISTRRLVTGLTPGASITWYWAGLSGKLNVGTFYGPASMTIYRVD